MSFENLYDSLYVIDEAHVPVDSAAETALNNVETLHGQMQARPDIYARGETYRQTVDNWIGKIRDRQITLSPVLAAAYATPGKPPRIIRSFEDLYDPWETPDLTGYFKEGRRLCGAQVQVNGHTQCFFSVKYLKGLLRNNPEGLRLIAVVYAKCN